MARYTSKYGIGQKVKVYGKPGLITAIHIRKGHRAYEFSYTDNGTPTSCTCEEVEICAGQISQIGFKK